LSRTRTLVATDVVLVAGLLAYVGAVWIVESAAGLDEPVRLISPLALLLALIPAGLWLGYFYMQDRQEPEPKHYVVGVCLLGAFCAAPIADFVLGELIPMSTAPRGGWPEAEHVLRAILAVGLAQELAKYLVVRYTVYLSDEFDEPIDAIIYMTAAGIGFAAAENVRYLGELSGVYLFVGAAHAVVTTMAHGCFAGVLGYALGRARFAARSAAERNLTLLIGLVVAAILNGVFALLHPLVRVVGTELSPEPWRGLAFAASFAAVVFMATSFLLRRQPGIKAPETAPPRREGALMRLDLAAVAGVLALLLIGWIATRSLARPELATFARRGLTVSYPAGWFPRDPGERAFPATVSFRSASAASEWLEIRLAPRPLVSGALVSVLDLERSQRFGAYYTSFGSSQRQVGGSQWSRTRYAHAYRAAPGDAPLVLHAVDYARVRGDTLYVVSVHAPEDRVGDLEQLLLSSVSIAEEKR
jgi:protease PrsW